MKYFLIKDYVERGEINLKHCPAEEMWPDVLTKLKQGGGFRKDRVCLMNVLTNYNNELEQTLTPAKLLAFENAGKNNMPTKKN